MSRLSLLLAVCLALPLTGCMMNAYSPDPNARIVQLMAESEDLRQIEKEMEEFWMKDQPAFIEGVAPVRDCRAGAASHIGRLEAEWSIAGITPAAPVLLTVANLHGEEVSLYAFEGAELKFLAKVASCDAVEVPAATGMRLAATFGRAPHCANYTARGAEAEVWLLRPAKAEGATMPVAR